ncbi:MAG TPA: hypothetical protein VG537_00400 [Candidatus Kapabacteria bacterium]|jgi:hypothetical protein|nr:hypothetical protein [Candidatus Kapabacteria bacterium]
MKNYQIEDTIVAYFDGRLNDAESAELLHRVSISPEIRQLFSEQEMLRNMAYSAARNVTVRPELEESLFAHIASLHEEEERAAAGLLGVARFWTVRRISIAAALVAVLLTGAVESFDTGTGISPRITTSSLMNIPGVASRGKDAAQVNSNPVATGSENAQAFEAPGSHIASHHFSNRSGSLANDQTVPVLDNMVRDNQARDNNDIANTISLTPMPRENAIERGIPSEIVQPHYATLSDLAATDGPERFEIGLDASGPGVTLPSNGFNLNRFAYEGRFAYNVDENDQVAVHIGNEYYQWLGVSSTNGNGFTSLVGSMEPKQFASYELFYDRIQPVADGRLFVSLGVGGGFYSVGNLMSAELGFKVPLSDRVMAGITFSVTRAHQNGPSEQEVLSSQSLPAIYSGADIHNTLNGVIQYGLSYRF